MFIDKRIVITLVDANMMYTHFNPLKPLIVYLVFNLYISL